MVKIAFTHIGKPTIVIGHSIPRVYLDSFIVTGDGHVVLACAVTHKSQIAIGRSVSRISRKSFFEIRDGKTVLAFSLIDKSPTIVSYIVSFRYPDRVFEKAHTVTPVPHLP